MKAFSIENNGTYTKEYYALIYDVFVTETKDDAMFAARKKLSDIGLNGEFNLQEFGDYFYHFDDGRVCGKLEPIAVCSFGICNGVVFRCAVCGREVDSSQTECFTTRTP